jgi:predicted TIM-barrel fold metal-dependent hydrolase
MRPALLALLLCGALARAAAMPIPFLDAHVHLNDPALQLELMQQHGACRAVVFWGGRSDNASVAAAARRWPGRFIPFASVSPERRSYRPLWEHEDPALLAELARLLESGEYRGIGEISVAHFPSSGFAETDFDPAGTLMEGIMALARRHRVPVLLHAEITRLDALERLLARHREVTLIWAHGGYTPLFLAERLLRRHPNLIYELSARSWPRHPRSPDYTLLRDGKAVWPEWLALIEALPQRFIIGTDASQRSRASDQMKFESVQNLLAQLSPATRERVAQANLLALLGLAPEAGCGAAETRTESVSRPAAAPADR